MISIPQRTRQIGTLVVLSWTVMACAGTEPSPKSPTETTSAAVPDTVAKADFERATRERDEARETLRQETIRYDEERSTLQAEVQARKEHDDLTAKAWTSIAAAETDLKALKEKAARGTVRDRQKMDKAIADAKTKIAAVEDQLRKIPSAAGPVWLDVKKSMEGAIDDLDRAVRKASE